MRLGSPLPAVLAMVVALGLAAPADAHVAGVVGEHGVDRVPGPGPATFDHHRSAHARTVICVDEVDLQVGDLIGVNRLAGHGEGGGSWCLGSAPDETGPVPVGLVRRSSRVTVGGPGSVVDEKSVTVNVRGQAANGMPVNAIVRRVAWRSRSHPVGQVMARHGLRWTYGNGDTQHFDAYGSRGRLAARYADAPGPALD